MRAFSERPVKGRAGTFGLIVALTLLPFAGFADVRPPEPQGTLTLEVAISNALARNPEAVMRGIEQWFGLKPTLSRRIVTDPLREPIVVVAKVVGMAPSAVQRILLFINPVIGLPPPPTGCSFCGFGVHSHGGEGWATVCALLIFAWFLTRPRTS